MGGFSSFQGTAQGGEGSDRFVSDTSSNVDDACLSYEERVSKMMGGGSE